MPLEKPYRNFAAGDLVYGLESPRATYMRNAFRGGVVIEQFHVLNNESSSHWRAAPRLMLNSFNRALRDHPAWKALAGKELTNANIRMKDKGGLWWATRSGRHVNFILDDIVMESVVGKDYQGRGHTEGEHSENRSVTGAELRWIYRHDWIREVREHIQFWYSGIQVGPPWETYFTIDHSAMGSATRPEDALVKNDGAKLWAAYKPQLRGLAHTAPAYESLKVVIAANK